MKKLIKNWVTSKEVKIRSKNIKKIRETKRINKMNDEFNKLYNWVLKNIDGKKITRDYKKENNKYNRTLKTTYTCIFDEETNIKVINSFSIGNHHMSMSSYFSIYLNGSVYSTSKDNCVKIYQLLSRNYKVVEKSGVTDFLKKIENEN